MTDLAAIVDALEREHRTNLPAHFLIAADHPARLECPTCALLADTPSVEPLDGARLDRIIAAYEKTSLEHDVFYEDFVEVVVAVRYERWIEARDARAALLPTQASDSPEKP